MTATGLYEEVLIAGFGGQGIIFAGKLLAYSAMQTGKEITCMPSYGAEVRGGTANCMVVIADQPIASPLVAKPDSLIVMNEASLNKFSPNVKAGGLVIYNSSLIDKKPQLPETITVLPVPADAVAIELGEKRIANMVILGAYLQKKGIITPQIAIDSLPVVMAKRYHKAIGINTQALQRGAQFAKDSG